MEDKGRRSRTVRSRHYRNIWQWTACMRTRTHTQTHTHTGLFLFSGFKEKERENNIKLIMWGRWDRWGRGVRALADTVPCYIKCYIWYAVTKSYVCQFFQMYMQLLTCRNTCVCVAHIKVWAQEWRSLHRCSEDSRQIEDYVTVHSFSKSITLFKARRWCQIFLWAIFFDLCAFLVLVRVELVCVLVCVCLFIYRPGWEHWGHWRQMWWLQESGPKNSVLFSAPWNRRQ